MREGWELKKLGDVCEKTSNINWKDNSDKTFQYIDLSAVSRDTLTITESSEINSSNAPSRAKKVLNTNDVIFATTRPTLNRMAIIPDKYNEDICSTGFTVLRAKEDAINAKYIFYSLQIPDFMKRMEKMQRGASYPAVSDKDVKDFEIPVPPLKEQKQIVNTLDKTFKQIDQAKANLEQNLHNAKELFQSKLNEVFSQRGEGWVEKSFDEVCQITSRLIDPKEKEYQDLLHIGAGNIESENGRLHSLKTAKEENLISGKFLFDDEMVLYSKIRPYLMKVVKCDFIGLCSADIYPLVPEKKEITQSFLYYLLLSNNFTEYAIKGSARAGMPKVNRKHLFDYICYLPNIEKQDEFTKMLDILFEESLKLQTHYQQKLNNLEELKKSILQKAFRGELT